MHIFSHEYFMRQAMNEAHEAFEIGEVPVGAVVCFENKIIARGHNMTEKLGDVTAHAEMLAITSAAAALGGKYLKNCTLYVTLEPCSMCAGAMYWAQLRRLVFAASDEKRGFRAMNIALHPTTETEVGLMAEESKCLIQKFFNKKRKRKK